MTSPRERLLLTLIQFMQEEIDCLRPVLSEWDEDKSCYVQFNRSEILRSAIETLEHKV